MCDLARCSQARRGITTRTMALCARLRIGEVKWVYSGAARPKWKRSALLAPLPEGMYCARCINLVDIIRTSELKLGSSATRQALIDCCSVRGDETSMVKPYCPTSFCRLSKA